MLQPNEHAAVSNDGTIAKLIDALRFGVEALKDPAIEAQVQGYFERHPNYSCDLIHVAAVACAFHAAKQRAATRTHFIQTASTIARRI